MNTAVSMTEVRKRFRDIAALDGLSLEVPAGTVFGLLGPNGAGKTTSVRVMLGLVGPDSGAVSVLGMDPSVEAVRIREQVGVLHETDGLYARLSAIENLEFHGRIRGLAGPERRARIEELLRTFGLWDRRRDPVARWSRGMRQKLAIARALIGRPRLLLLDEPFAGLDPAAAAELRQQVVALARDGRATVLLTSHDLGHVERACDGVAVLRAGRVLRVATPQELRSGSDEMDVQVSGRGLTPPVLESLRELRLIRTFDLAEGGARIRCSREARPPGRHS